MFNERINDAVFNFKQPAQVICLISCGSDIGPFIFFEVYFQEIVSLLKVCWI